jgi:putative transcriptional regulator
VRLRGGCENVTHDCTLFASNIHAGNFSMKGDLMNRAICAVGGAMAAALLMFGAPQARAEDLSKPLLLVASPSLQGPYTHTALLVVPMGNKHVGFILNRSTETRMSSAFPEHAPSAKVVDPIYFGGPEASDALFALVPRDPGQPSIHLFGDVYMTASGKSIDRIIETTPNDARYFAGFVGWMPDELQAEIAKGFWYVGDPEASVVFRKDAGEEMWSDLSKRLGKGRAPHAPGEVEASGTSLALPRG